MSLTISDNQLTFLNAFSIEDRSAILNATVEYMNGKEVTKFTDSKLLMLYYIIDTQKKSAIKVANSKRLSADLNFLEELPFKDLTFDECQPAFNTCQSNLNDSCKVIQSFDELHSSDQTSLMDDKNENKNTKKRKEKEQGNEEEKKRSKRKEEDKEEEIRKEKNEYTLEEKEQVNLYNNNSLKDKEEVNKYNILYNSTEDKEEVNNIQGEELFKPEPYVERKQRHTNDYPEIPIQGLSKEELAIITAAQRKLEENRAYIRSAQTTYQRLSVYGEDERFSKTYASSTPKLAPESKIESDMGKHLDENVSSNTDENMTSESYNDLPPVEDNMSEANENDVESTNEVPLTKLVFDFKNSSTSENEASDEVKPIKRFQKPTLEEVSGYCKERNNHVDPQNFIDFYESKGWLVGKTPMKNWQAAVRTWERHNKTSNNKSDWTQNHPHFQNRNDDLDDMEEWLPSVNLRGRK